MAIAKGTGGGNVLQSNFIGTNAAGTAGIANLHGIQITDWSISGTFNDDSMTQR